MSVGIYSLRKCFSLFLSNHEYSFSFLSTMIKVHVSCSIYSHNNLERENREGNCLNVNVSYAWQGCLRWAKRKRVSLTFVLFHFDSISYNVNSLLLSIGTISTCFPTTYNHPLCYFQGFYDFQLLEKC